MVLLQDLAPEGGDAFSGGAALAEGILERFGLNSGAIRQVMMHRDIVPRAFACDYALVADLLSRVSESFKHLESLHRPRRQARPCRHPLCKT